MPLFADALSAIRNPRGIAFANRSLTGGKNTRDHPARIEGNEAELIENYISRGDGIIETREGLKKLMEIEAVFLISGASDVFTVGEVLTGGMSSETAEVVFASSSLVFIKNASDNFTLTETLTGGSSGETATLDTQRFSMRPTMLERLTDDILVWSFHDGTDMYLGKFILSMSSTVLIRTFAVNTEAMEGERHGKYFLASSGTTSAGSEKIGMFFADGLFLNFTVQSSNFVFGETVTEATSGATGKVFAQIDNGATGTLLLINITGVFIGGEALTGDVAGDGTSNGVAFDWFTITDAPKAKHLSLYTRTGRGSHLIAFNTDVSPNGIQGSKEYNDPLTFPFLDWTPNVPPDDGDAFITVFGDGGDINKGVSHRNRIYPFSQDATGVFHIERIDVATVGSSQLQVTDDAEPNFGGFTAKSTRHGIAFTNENGWFLLNFVQGDKQEFEITTILGKKQVEELDLSNSFIDDDGRQLIFLSCAKNSSVNNYYLVYDVEQQLVTEITGWSTAAGARIQGDLYAVGAQQMKIFRLMDGFDDDGKPIAWEILYRQEDGGDPTILKSALDLWFQGELSTTSLLRVDLNRWSQENRAFENFRTFFMAGGDADFASFGFSATEYSALVAEGAVLVSEDFFHKANPLENFLKVQMRISSQGRVGHKIHLGYLLDYFDKSRVKLRNFLTSNPS